MCSRPGLYPAPTYHSVETSWDRDKDAPGPRCGHSLTAVDSPEPHGPRLILFGGITMVKAGDGDPKAKIKFSGVTNCVHCYDVVTRKWRRIRPAGDPPSPRAGHAAAAVGQTLVIQGGTGPAGHLYADLYILDMTEEKFKWHKMVVQDPGPGPRYGHVMDLVAKRYLVTIGGYDGKRVLSDAWVLDTAQEPHRWLKLNPKGDEPSARMYASASTRSDGMLFLCGGKDTSGMPLADAYRLLMNGNGQWEWTLASGMSPSGRYQHAAVFVGARLHVTGGISKGGRAIKDERVVAVLDTVAGVWLDRNGIVTSSRISKAPTDVDRSLELMQRCLHASASAGFKIYIYGGLRGDILLDDLLTAENSPSQSEICSPVLNSERDPTLPCSKTNQVCSSSHVHANSDESPEIPASGDLMFCKLHHSLSVDKKSTDKLVEASTTEAEEVSVVQQVSMPASMGHLERTSVLDKRLHVLETSSDGCDTEDKPNQTKQTQWFHSRVGSGEGRMYADLSPIPRSREAVSVETFGLCKCVLKMCKEYKDT